MAYGTILWHAGDTEDILRQRYQGERAHELRPRWHALWLLRQGWRRREVVAALGIHPRTLRDWIAWYRQGGCVEVARHRMGNPHGNPARLTPAQQAVLRETAGADGFRRVKDAQVWVETTWGVTYTYDGMRSLLQRLQIHPKVPRPLAREADVAAQSAWQKGGCGKRSGHQGRPRRRPLPGRTSSESGCSGASAGSGPRGA